MSKLVLIVQYTQAIVAFSSYTREQVLIEIFYYAT